MSYTLRFSLGFISIIVFLSSCQMSSEKKENEQNLPEGMSLKGIAPTPPLGWNSYDCYDWRINEEEFKANVDFMAENLKEHGYQYAVVDFLWYIIDSVGDIPIQSRGQRSRLLNYYPDGNLKDPISIDEYGRVTPDTVRFPSSSGGRGFKPLADYVHSKGLKFGIHIMRGVPRIAHKRNLPVKNTEYSCSDISEPWDTCSWENSMYGVNFEAEGAQDYYNSILELYASWGVDFIKADDIMYPEWHPEEIKMLRKGIINSGRPMVLSLSLGEPRFHESELLISNANMWRISGDFWDNWDQILRQFDLTNFWSNYTQPGSWPDADMLPVGHLALNGPKGEPRMSKLSWPEHQTLITLWSMARSPLMIGGDLPSSPDSTFLYLTNDEVLYVNQNSENGHRIYQGWADNTIIWIADDSRSTDMFFALFNVGDTAQELNFDFELYHLRDEYTVRDLWQHKELGTFSGSFTDTIHSHGAGLYRLRQIK